MSFRIVDNPREARFEIYSDEVLAGICEYQGNAPLVGFTHTEVFPEFKGKGLAAPLVRYALDAMKVESTMVLPYCTFVSGFIEKYGDEYLQLVPLNRRAEFRLPS